MIAGWRGSSYCRARTAAPRRVVEQAYGVRVRRDGVGGVRRAAVFVQKGMVLAPRSWFCGVVPGDKNRVQQMMTVC